MQPRRGIKKCQLKYSLDKTTPLKYAQVFKAGQDGKSLVRYRGYEVIPQIPSNQEIKLVTLTKVTTAVYHITVVIRNPTPSCFTTYIQ